MIALFSGINLALAQCDEKKLEANCKGQVTDGFTFVKSFTLDPSKLENGNLEYSYIFSKDTQYVLSLCSMAEKTGNEVAVAIYDNNRALLFNSAENKNEPMKKLIYKCQTTGVHYLTFTFLNDKANCHQAQIGFKRQ